MKSVLLHINDDCAVNARLDFALDFCRAHFAHLTCVQTTSVDALLASQPMGGAFATAAIFEELDENEAALKTRIQDRLGREDICWDWHSANSDASAALVTWSALADVLIVSEVNQGDGYKRPLPVVDHLTLHAACPVLVLPEKVDRYTPGCVAIVAWNGSPEAANALKSALPVLRLASSVRIISVEEDDRAFPQTGASTYLARHGITSELRPLAANGWPPADILIDCARAQSAGIIVMGAYGRSRFREALLGGTTRKMLGSPPAPLLLHH